MGILVWQSGKRSSENGFQTTFGLGRKGSSLERPRAVSIARHRMCLTAAVKAAHSVLLNDLAARCGAIPRRVVSTSGSSGMVGVLGCCL